MVHGFGQSSRDCSASPPNWRDDLCWASGWVFHGECTNVCNAHWRKAINYHDLPSYYTVWTLKLERILSLCQNQQETLTYGWDPKMAIYPYGLGYWWWRLVTIGILNRGTMISHVIETVCPLEWSKGHVIMKYVVIVISLMEFDICSLELKYINWLHNTWDL